MASTQGQSRQQRLLESLTRHRSRFAYALLGLGAALAVVALWLAFRLDADARFGFDFDWGYWPEWVACFLLTAVAVAAGLWLLLAPAGQVNEANVRILVLAAGGLTGLMVALATVARAWLWRQEVIFGGLEGWRANFGWLVLFIMVELGGLGLMFASLLLARTEERSNAVLRRLLYGYNTVLSGILLLAILVVANILVYVLFPASYQWTKTRALYDLSSQTRNILTHLKEPVQVYVIMSQGDRVYDDVRTLLDNVQAVTDKVKVTTIFPDFQRKDVEKLVDRFPDLNIGRGLVVVYGNPTSEGKSLAAYIPVSQLIAGEANPRARQSTQTLLFKGEDALMTQINFLKEGRKKPKIYFTQQNDELRLTDARPGSVEGVGLLQQHLTQDNFEVAGLRLVDSAPGGEANPQTVVATEVPKDAAVVVIANPRTPFSPQAVSALRRYLQNKGKLLVMLGLAGAGKPRHYEAPRTGLEQLLAANNVEVTAAYVLRGVNNADDNPVVVLASAPSNSSNGIAKAMAGLPMLLHEVRPVQGRSRSGRYQVDVLLEVNPGVEPNQNVWMEKDLQTLLNPMGYLSELGERRRRLKAAKDPIPVAVAVSDREEEQPRLVVVGQYSLATNRGQAIFPRYYAFLENSLEWLLGRGEKLGIPPQKSNRFELDVARLDESRQARMRYLPAWLMAVALIGLGTGIWIVRRR